MQALGCGVDVGGSECRHPAIVGQGPRQATRQTFSMLVPPGYPIGSPQVIA